MSSRKRVRSRSRSSSRSSLEKRVRLLESLLNRKSTCKNRSSRVSSKREYQSRRRRDYSESSSFESQSSSGCSSPQTESKALDRSPSSGSAGNEDVLVLHDEEGLDEETIKLLGDDPDLKKTNKIELNGALTVRWENLLASGLSREARTNLMEKYPVPLNLMHLKAPDLNVEVAGILSKSLLKRDKYLASSQTQLGSALSALGCVLNLLLNESTADNNSVRKAALQPALDAGRILVDLHYQLSQSRRFCVVPLLDKTIKQIAINSKVDSMLFGSDFNDKIKAQKEIEKNSRELKSIQSVSLKQTNTRGGPSSLNWNAPSRSYRQREPRYQRGQKPLYRQEKGKVERGKAEERAYAYRKK